MLYRDGFSKKHWTRRSSEEERNWSAASRHVQVIRSSICLMNRRQRMHPSISDCEPYLIDYVRDVTIASTMEAFAISRHIALRRHVVNAPSYRI